MPLVVKLLVRAQTDLRQIYQYIAADSPMNAAAFLAELRTKILSLAEFPLVGPIPRDERLKKRGYRFVPHGAYLIFYKVSPSTVTVYRVLHGGRQYKAIL